MARYSGQWCRGCTKKFLHPGKHQTNGTCKGKGWSDKRIIRSGRTQPTATRPITRSTRQIVATVPLTFGKTPDKVELTIKSACGSKISRMIVLGRPTSEVIDCIDRALEANFQRVESSKLQELTV